MSNGWKLIFVVPNLQLAKPIEYAGLALVPSKDERLQEIKEKCHASRCLLNGISNQFGQNINPCAIILDESVPSFSRIDIITDFRNCIAISAIIEAHRFCTERTFSLMPMFSDYFDFYPITPSKDSQHLIVHNPHLLGLYDLESFKGHVSSLIIHPKTAVIDETILNLLFRLWRKDPERKSWKVRAIFRSLQIAYQASTIYYDNPFSQYDVGSRIALWVSAHETLIHPGGRGRADLRTVLDLLGRHSFSKPELKQRRYRIYDRRNRVYSINLIQKLYYQLYYSRNAFLHGNPIKDMHIYPFGDNRMKPLLTFAPFIYKTALIEQLSNLGVKKERRGRPSLVEAIIEGSNFEKPIVECYKWRRP